MAVRAEDDHVDVFGCRRVVRPVTADRGRDDRVGADEGEVVVVDRGVITTDMKERSSCESEERRTGRRADRTGRSSSWCWFRCRGGVFGCACVRVCGRARARSRSHIGLPVRVDTTLVYHVIPSRPSFRFPKHSAAGISGVLRTGMIAYTVSNFDGVRRCQT